MFPIAFKIGSLVFYTHGIVAVIGIIASVAFLYYSARRQLDCSYLFDNMIYTILIGIVGARIVYFILYHNQFGQFREILYLWQGGLVSYGGFIIGGLFLILLLRKQKQPIPEWFDHLAIAFPLGLSIGRFGEFLSGENFGVQSTSRISVRGYIPINLYESALCLIIFLVLVVISKRYLKVERSSGRITLLLIMLYTAGRTVIDFWRAGNTIFFNLSLSQLTSIILFVASLFLFLLSNIRKKGHHVTIS